MKKVYIIGAGASSEVGFPLGNQLLNEIGKLLNFEFKDFLSGELKSGDYEIYKVLKSISESKGELSANTIGKENSTLESYIREAKFIYATTTFHRSIDNLINQNRGNKRLELIAKLAIVKNILDYEKKFISEYHLSDNSNEIDFKKLINTWYDSFIKNLFERATVDELSTRFKDISLIVFNYDRCVEHILFESIKQCYKLSETETTLVMDCLDIYHPYGSLGKLAKLEFDCAAVEKNHLEFGSKLYSDDLLRVSGKIRTFTEGTNPDDSLINDIRFKLQNADKVVFLGFGFESLNMDLLGSNVNTSPNYNRNCFATVKGISSNNLNFITNKIMNLFESSCRINTSDLKCNDFFDEYSEALSFLNE